MRKFTEFVEQEQRMASPRSAGQLYFPPERKTHDELASIVRESSSFLRNIVMRIQNDARRGQGLTAASLAELVEELKDVLIGMGNQF